MSFYNECSQGSLKATGLQLVARLRSRISISYLISILRMSPFRHSARCDLCPHYARLTAGDNLELLVLLNENLDSSRFPQPALHELCPCCVRPIAARLSSFWQLLYQNLFLCKRGNCWCNSLFIYVTIGSPFFQRPTRDELHPSFA